MDPVENSLVGPNSSRETISFLWETIKLVGWREEKGWDPAWLHPPDSPLVLLDLAWK